MCTAQTPSWYHTPFILNKDCLQTTTKPPLVHLGAPSLTDTIFHLHMCPHT